MNSSISPRPLATHGGFIPHWIDGKALVSSGRRADVFNPSLGRAVREVGLAGAEDMVRGHQMRKPQTLSRLGVVA